MHPLLKLTSSIAAAVGIITCAVSGLARISGFFYIAGYQTTTLFMVGVGIMVFACLIKLEVLAGQQAGN